jgi:hypothetical protein
MHIRLNFLISNNYLNVVFELAMISLDLFYNEDKWQFKDVRLTLSLRPSLNALITTRRTGIDETPSGRRRLSHNLCHGWGS